MSAIHRRKWRRLVAGGGMALICAAGPGCDGPGAPESETFVIGLCHVRSEEDARLAVEAGTGSVRNTLAWRLLEREPGRFGIPVEQRDLRLVALERGLGMVTPIAYGNPLFDDGGYPVSDEAVAAFARASKFAASVLRRPRPVFEIWNEWNLGIGMGDRGPGTPEDYVRVQAAAYAAIKETRDPPFVLGGAMAGAGLTDDWLLRACEAGMLEHLDGLSFHPYCYWMEGRQAMPERGMLGLIRSLEEIVDRFPGGADVPMYLTEIGWPTHGGPDGVTLDEQAHYASRALLLARANPRIRGVWWFNLRDRDSSSDKIDHRFGLLFSDGTPKPAFFAFRDTTLLIKDVIDARHERLGETVHAVRLRRRDGRAAIALWVARPNAQARVELDTAGSGGTTVRLMGSSMEREAEVSDGRIGVSVGNMPVILSGIDEGTAILGVTVTGSDW